jgi:hypothetical protein
MNQLTAKKSIAEVYWMAASVAFGMCFLGGLTTAWEIYGTSYSSEQKLWWTAATLFLLLCERITWKNWRKLVAQDLTEFKLHLSTL